MFDREESWSCRVERWRSEAAAPRDWTEPTVGSSALKLQAPEGPSGSFSFSLICPDVRCRSAGGDQEEEEEVELDGRQGKTSCRTHHFLSTSWDGVHPVLAHLTWGGKPVSRADLNERRRPRLPSWSLVTAWSSADFKNKSVYRATFKQVPARLIIMINVLEHRIWKLKQKYELNQIERG